jgi:hypothetical protein
MLRNPYPLAHIPGIRYPSYDGIVVKIAVSCEASQYKQVCKMVEADDQQATMIPIPDNDDMMEELLRD